MVCDDVDKFRRSDRSWLASPEKSWPSPQEPTGRPGFAHMSQRTESYFHLHLVSDATGETLTTVARAATAQYTTVVAVEHVFPLIRTQKQLDLALAEITEAPGIVLYTLLEDVLVTRLEQLSLIHI